jgi:hypothetical protein
MNRWLGHQPVTLPEYWRQVSFIFFDLGVMNVIGGVGVTYFYLSGEEIFGFIRYRSSPGFFGVRRLVAAMAKAVTSHRTPRW